MRHPNISQAYRRKAAVLGVKDEKTYSLYGKIASNTHKVPTLAEVEERRTKRIALAKK